MVSSLEGRIVGTVVGLKVLFILGGAVDGSTLLLSVIGCDGVPPVTGGDVGTGIVVNWPKVAVVDMEPSGSGVAEAATDTWTGSPANVRPGVKGCVSSEDRSDSWKRICKAGPTVKRGGPASFVAPHTPPRKSVVSVVHVKPLYRPDQSDKASQVAVLKHKKESVLTSGRSKRRSPLARSQGNPQPSSCC